MALSWNEIRERALNFSNKWEGESRERAEKDSFWNDFFEVFGKSRKRLAVFEKQIQNLKGNTGFIDLFWKGTLLIEHKSRGKDLDAALEQALDYCHGLSEEDLPKYILVSDFEIFKLWDIETNKTHEFRLNEFHKNINLFGFIAGYKRKEFKEEDPVNIKAAELMGKLHDQLEEIGYAGHRLEVFLVRLLFCLFADDTGIFDRDSFKDLIEKKSKEDGSDLGALLAQFFQVLDTSPNYRLKTLDEDLSSFPYVNGKLFEESLSISAFNSKMRSILLECCYLDWGQISPAIFGGMFQSVMDPSERRNLGAHYTSEKNILKLIKPLFLDELHQEFETIKSNKNKLRQFHEKLSSLKFLDPACGCGNFLIITYRELRLLELEVLKKLYGTQQVTFLDELMKVDVDQFYGIEYDEFPARIAEVALWLTDHQMNLMVSEAFGIYFARLPLKKSAVIVHGNALTTNWEDVISRDELSYIIGNPPFIGSKMLNQNQRVEMAELFKAVEKGKILDYVSAWYYKSAEFINGTKIKTAFVSTNSITQGEQVGVLWETLINKFDTHIHFAHTTFKWTNEARGKAAVYCVIIGFASFDSKINRLFSYENVNGEPSEENPKNINPYLVNAENILIQRRSKPLCNIPKMSFGNMPLDGGNLILSREEAVDILKNEPSLKNYILPLISAREFLNRGERWCLWLSDIDPKIIKQHEVIYDRIQRVRDFRMNSKAPSTRKHASTPYLFRDTKRYNSFIVIPRVSSKNRAYIPLGFFGFDSIVSDTCMAIPEGKIYHFGVLMSEMHMSWVKYTCGRLKSDYRYSKDIVYNNYPWPNEPSVKNIQNVEAKAQKVLDVRAEFPESSLADLYNPLLMPPKLVKAHKELDKAVDLSYRLQLFKSEASRIEYLFDLYKQYTEPLLNP